MGRHTSSDFDPFLGKESLDALAKMGFGKRQPRLGPPRYHGIAARTRLAVAGKRSVATTSQHRHQHHKERMTINQVDDLAGIVREIDSFTKVGKRVPVAVWEKYDRVNKRHKKHEEMIAIAAEVRSKASRKRGPRPAEEQDDEEQDNDRKSYMGGGFADEGELGRTDQDNETKKNGTGSRESWAPTNGDPASPPTASKDSTGPSPQTSALRRRPRGLEAVPAPFQGGGRCTFGSGRGEAEAASLEMLERRATHVPIVGSGGGFSSSWQPQERAKLNELYWELGRPSRRGVDAEREHFLRYTQRHCMVFPHRSRAEVVERLKLMFRYNSMKEPHEREHWLKLRARRGFRPDATLDKTARVKHSYTPSTVGKSRQLLDFASLVNESSEPAIIPHRMSASKESPPSNLKEHPLFYRSGGIEGGDKAAVVGGLSAAAASYAAEAIERAANSASASPSRRPRTNARAVGAGGAVISPFYDPTRPNSPAWGFGEAPPINSSSSSHPGSRGDGGSRGGGGAHGGSRGGRGSRGSSGAAGGLNGGLDDDDADDGRPEETELLEYTSLGAQISSGRATSPAFAFPREGLGSENLSMFQADKKPEPGPGSFRPNLDATSNHPGVRCGVLIGGRVASRGATGGGGDGGVGGSGRGTGGGATGITSTRPEPGPGQYSAWDAMGRQILSTRPSSPVVTFATGEWELR
ncbi:unnamed protein product [Scytosiphon promiscuus]